MEEITRLIQNFFIKPARGFIVCLAPYFWNTGIALAMPGISFISCPRRLTPRASEPVQKILIGDWLVQIRCAPRRLRALGFVQRRANNDRDGAGDRIGFQD